LESVTLTNVSSALAQAGPEHLLVEHAFVEQVFAEQLSVEQDFAEQDVSEQDDFFAQAAVHTLAAQESPSQPLSAH
jgi:hypothetical protein